MSPSDIQMIIDRLAAIEDKIDSLSAIINGNGKVGLCEQTRNNATNIEMVRQDLTSDLASFKTTTLKWKEELQSLLKGLSEVLAPAIEAKGVIAYLKKHWRGIALTVIFIILTLLGWAKLSESIPEIRTILDYIIVNYLKR